MDASVTSAPTPASVPHLSAQDVRSIVEPLIRDQAGDLRRYFGAELESLSGRLAADVSRRVRVGCRRHRAPTDAATCRTPAAATAAVGLDRYSVCRGRRGGCTGRNSVALSG
jgi:hypothetical protein